MWKGFTGLIMETKNWTLMRIGKESKEEEHSKMENKMEKVKYIKEWGGQREKINLFPFKNVF